MPNKNQFDFTGFLENFNSQNSSKNDQIINKEQIKEILNNIDVNDPNTTINSSVIINGSNQNIQEQLINLKSKLGGKFNLIEKFLPPEIRQQLQNLGDSTSSSSSISSLPPSQISKNSSSYQDLSQFNTSSGLPPSEISKKSQSSSSQNSNPFPSQDFSQLNNFDRDRIENNKRLMTFVILLILSLFIGFVVSNNYNKLKDLKNLVIKETTSNLKDISQIFLNK